MRDCWDGCPCSSSPLLRPCYSESPEVGVCPCSGSPGVATEERARLPRGVRSMETGGRKGEKRTPKWEVYTRGRGDVYTLTCFGALQAATAVFTSTGAVMSTGKMRRGVSVKITKLPQLGGNPGSECLWGVLYGTQESRRRLSRGEKERSRGGVWDVHTWSAKDTD